MSDDSIQSAQEDGTVELPGSVLRERPVGYDGAVSGAKELSDLIDLRVSAAQQQWQLIRNRQPLEPGRNQVDFVPVEVVLCHAASRLVEHRRFGSSTSDNAPEPIQLLARLFQRPASSVLAKMANLDGTRAHGARFDHPAGIVWAADPSGFDRMYASTILAARRSGVDAVALPDFLATAWMG